MKKIAALLVLGSLVTGMGVGCAYSGVSGAGNDKAVVARNDGFLFGILRKVFVCKVTDAGLTSCGSNESP